MFRSHDENNDINTITVHQNHSKVKNHVFGYNSPFKYENVVSVK
jgi:hypothetical protein